MEDFVPFVLAVKLREKGFNEYCYKYYQRGVLDSDDCWNRYNRGTADRCSAPTISQVLKWLRKEKGIYTIIFIDDDSDTPVTYEIYKNKECVCTHQGEYFTLKDWNECELRAIEYVLDNLL